MTWNYRIMKTKQGQFSIVEAYYDESTGTLMSYCEADLQDWETVAELKSSYDMIHEAFTKPYFYESEVREWLEQ